MSPIQRIKDLEMRNALAKADLKHAEKTASDKRTALGELIKKSLGCEEDVEEIVVKEGTKYTEILERVEFIRKASKIVEEELKILNNNLEKMRDMFRKLEDLIFQRNGPHRYSMTETGLKVWIGDTRWWITIDCEAKEIITENMITKKYHVFNWIHRPTLCLTTVVSYINGCTGWACGIPCECGCCPPIH